MLAPLPIATQATLQGGLSLLDGAVLLGVLAAVTWLGHARSGKQTELKDFFLGGRSLPWWAVAASIVATEISAVTFVSLPSVVWREGGNLTYLQIGLFGSLVARAVVGFVLVPAYYEREIYSPYDYVAQRFGEAGRRVTTALFTLGGILGQSARVYLTAVVFEVVLFDELAAVEAATGIPPLAASVLVIAVVAIAWTWMGGIATVVWTDAALFLLFLVGIAATLLFLGGELSGGLWGALSEGWDAGKFRLLDTSWDPHRAYTLPVALLVASWGQIGPYGTDQLMVQRLLCCSDARQARKAILASMGGMGVTFLVGTVGVALWAWTREFELSAAGAAMVAEKPDRIFPVIIAEVLPNGVKGLVLAGAFAAAISSLDSILAALSQTTLTALGRAEGEARETLRLSRLLVLVYGVLLAAAALGIDAVAGRYASILDLALAMAGYTGGALLAAFFLAWWKPLRVNGSGLVWSAPLSVLAVFALAWHQVWAQQRVVQVAVLMLGLWLLLPAGRRRSVRRTLTLLAGLALCWALARYGVLPPDGTPLPWPWYLPTGAVVAFAFGWLLDEERDGPAARGAGRAEAS
ncbi:MAG: hypothetical protein ISQ08_12895 [Planctomycetes bacterium]|nr:hypothetical protein [Planctomycetota bacterium]